MIDTQAIRSKILDVAMRGQLTEQHAEDGTAEELYQQIQIKKQSLIDGGQIKKERPLPDITAEMVPFTIPQSWKWVYLGELFQHNTGKALNASDTQGQLLEYITTSNLYWDHFELDELKTMPFTESEIEKCTVKKGDLLVCEGGDIGRSAIWPYDYDMRIQNHIHRLRKYSDSVCTEFYYYLLWLYKQTGRINGIGIGLQGFSSKRVHSLVVPLVPYNEAIRVVEIIKQAFSDLDVVDELQEQYTDNLSSLKNKLIDSAIQGKLTEQLPEDGTAEELYQQIQREKQELVRAGKIKKDKPLPEITEEEIPFDIPDNWKMCRLGSVITLVSGTDYKPEEYNDENRGTPYITGASNLLPDGVLINRWTETPRCIANTGDVLLVCKGSGYGKVAMCDVEEAHIARQIMAVKKTDLLNMRYILYFLTANFAYLKGKGQGLIPGVDRNSVLSMIFPLPPLKEQNRIVDKLDELTGIIEA